MSLSGRHSEEKRKQDKNRDKKVEMKTKEQRKGRRNDKDSKVVFLGGIKGLKENPKIKTVEIKT